MASVVPAALQPKGLTTHYGGSYWLDDSRRGSGAGASSSPTPSPPSFALEPNPTRVSSTTILSPVQPHHVAYGVAAVAATTILYKLYKRWRRDPTHQQLKKRHRLTHKFAEVHKAAAAGAGADELPLQPKRSSWLWRLFFRDEERPSHKASSGKHMRSPSRRVSGRSPSPSESSASPSPSPAPAAAKRGSFLSTIFSSSSSAAGPAPSRMSASSAAPDQRQPLSQNDQWASFINECKALESERGVIVSSPTDFYLKRERIRLSNLAAMQRSPNGCDANIHIVTSFDRTLTAQREAVHVQLHAHAQPSHPYDPPVVPAPAIALAPPSLCHTSQSLLDDFLPTTYSDACRKLFQQYYPLETSVHIAHSDKQAYMREWWQKCQALLSLDEYKLTRNKITHMVRTTLEQGRMRLRPGVQSLLNGEVGEQSLDGLCARFSIPVVVLSGGIHDVIEELLLHHGLRLHNSNRSDLSDAERERCFRSQVHLLANPLRWGTKPTGASSIAKHRATSRHGSRHGSKHGSPSGSPVPTMQRGLHPALAATMPPPVSISSVTSGTSVCLGFDQRFLVHSLNKSYERVLEQPALVRAVAAKPHVLLLGNTLQDANLLLQGIDGRAQAVAHLSASDAAAAAAYEAAEAMHKFALDEHAHPQHHALPPFVAPPPLPSPHASEGGEVLRVGFLNDLELKEEKLAAFKAAYDVVIIGDGDMEFVQRTLAYICGAVDQSQQFHHHTGAR